MKNLGIRSYIFCKSFTKRISFFDIPFLFSMQINSYKLFLQSKILKRKKIGLQRVFSSIFPIYSNDKNLYLKFLTYRLEKSIFNKNECKKRGLTYSFSLIALLQLVIYEKDFDNIKKIKEIKEQEVYICDIPTITNFASFIINGTERTVISQIYRSPGIFFEHDKGKTHSSGKILFSAKIIPYRGSWLSFEFDYKDILYFRIDRRRKMPLTIFLKALGLNIKNIFNIFYTIDEFEIVEEVLRMNIIPKNLIGRKFYFDIFDENKNLLVVRNKKIDKKDLLKIKEKKSKWIIIDEEFLYNRIIAENIKNISGELITFANEKITPELLLFLKSEKIKFLKTINIDNKNSCISKTLKNDNINNVFLARVHIYKNIRSVEVVNKNSVKIFFKNLFFNEESYSLSFIGRMKLNKKFGFKILTGPNILTISDIIFIIKILINIKDGKENIDDIDHLENRRIKNIGELLEKQFKVGFLRIEKNIKELLNLSESKNLIPCDFINSKPINAVMREFFCTSQLSQFLDQINPLSEITHKRRVTSLGPGGLSRERASFESRDVHYTHYGRICPIETPEGPNIGLINSLALYSKIDKYGFLVTPYYKVENCIITNKVEYLTASEEDNFFIAQVNINVDKNKKLLDSFIVVRNFNNTFLVPAEKVQYMDVSFDQVVSIAASLIPFLEHNDANRVLMGANMQRQAVPNLKLEKPLISTGIEKIVILNSSTSIKCLRSGIVTYVDGRIIKIKINKKEVKSNFIDIDVYNLLKYIKSNQNTNINQKPNVKVGDYVVKNDIIADGFGSCDGILSLGHNLLVAFMSWKGYNFEDSILISEKVVLEDKFTSIHIEEFITIARETRIGDEEITRNIENIPEEQLLNLDETGVIFVGTKISPGDILVGKTTPKEDNIQISPEEKLLLAVFSKKFSNIKDTSLRVPNGIYGVVIDVQIFTKKISLNNKNTLKIVQDKFKKYKSYLKKCFLNFKKNIFKKIKKFLINKKVSFAPKVKSGFKITKDYLLSIKKNLWLNIILKNTLQRKRFLKFKEIVFLNRLKFNIRCEKRAKILFKGHKLPRGINKIVKVYIAIKKKLQAGDKMSGRHGNKGVVSRILSVEDMPYLSDGTTIDIILNPLGIPSRMNVGQLLEAHLGWASKGLGERIKEILKYNFDTLKLRKFLNKIFNYSASFIKFENFEKYSDKEIINLAKNLCDGVPFVTPIFDGATEKEINYMLDLAYPKDIIKKMNISKNKKQVKLYDGCTGEVFNHFVTIGYIYYLKLNHLVTDKMHARSTGPYSLITQQPLRGKSQFGGQRLGEMEVWALEAYGASYILQEMLTIKSDDIKGRLKVYENLIQGNYTISTGIPESFNVLIKEIRSLGIDIDLEYE